MDNSRYRKLDAALDARESEAFECDALRAQLDEERRAMSQIASSLAEFDRVEAIGMQSATMPEKVDALLRDLARLRRKDRAAGAPAPREG